MVAQRDAVFTDCVALSPPLALPRAAMSATSGYLVVMQRSSVRLAGVAGVAGNAQAINLDVLSL